MDIQQLFIAAILGIVEGITEFLPISSTGHLIIVGDLLSVNDDGAHKAFDVIVQLAAILAVCWEFRARFIEQAKGVFFKPRSRAASWFFLMIIIGCVPAAVLGLKFHKVIEDVLFNPYVVASALIVGGIVILIIERPRKTPQPVGKGIEDMTVGDAVKIGFAQAVAMIPGTSRSGATIIGGMIFGLSRVAATEFSFFLAIPTMLGATLLSTYKHWGDFTMGHIPFLVVGCITSFLSAMWAVRFLIRFISTHTFVSFAYYRIVFGLIVFATGFFNLVDWSKP